MRRALALAALSLAACGWGLRPGPTPRGVAYAVPGPKAAAVQAAASEALGLFVAPGDPSRPKAEELIAARAAEFAGKSRAGKGGAVVEIKLDALAAALEKEKLLAPEGFAAGPAKVVVLVAETERVLNLGIGPAGDALRRGLAARGASATDGGDPLNEKRYRGKTAKDLVAAWRGAGAEWVLLARAPVEDGRDEASGAWRARAVLYADLWDAEKGAAVESFTLEASAVDLSTPAARGKALEAAGEEAAARAHAAMLGASNGRTRAAVLVYGGRQGLPVLLEALRGLQGVRGAHLAGWTAGPDKSAVVRVYLEGFRVDELAARLLRRLPSATLLSVENEDGRLAVELPGGGDA